MQTNQWLSYEELAWTESVLASPDGYADVTDYYADLIKQHSAQPPRSLLHLGCGAGGNDYTFKKHFRVTGVDISRGMLDLARRTNPDARYVLGDMRDVALGERFDAVAIPDSVDYLATLPDLRSAIATACRHLLPGGVFLVVAKTRETFRENNFCYTGRRDNVEITLFENNYIPPENPSTYEATLVYLIRRDGELSIHNDRHTLGLFSQAEWMSVLEGAGLEVKQVQQDGVYERFILGEGAYPMQVFIGIKPAH